MKIAIIGGGIGGLTTALALKQVGFEPEIFEQAPQMLDVGAAIAIWPNALRILMRLGVGEEVLQHAGVIEQIRWQDQSGKSLNKTILPTTDVPAVALHRADLQRVLLHALPGNSIHLAHDFTGYQHEHDTIRLNFTSQSPVYSDALIGADGLHSQVREQLWDGGAPVHRCYTVWRGMTNDVPGGVERSTAIEIHGRGQRFGIGPVGNGRVGWWASSNANADKRGTETERETLLRLFNGWCAPVGQLIAKTSGTILRNDAFDRASTRSWGLGRVTLLGDAIHPTTPNLGQGGCMAIEDAVVLARCLAQDREPSQAFRAYERSRFTRTSLIANCSRIYGTIGQWENPLGTRLRNMMISAVPQYFTHRLLRLIFDYDAWTARI